MIRSLLFIQAILVLSGIAGLGYQLVWVRQFAIGLGHEIPSMLAVVAGFFGGLALGAWSLDNLIGRSRLPGRWYVVLELAIGAWALLSIPLIQWLVDAAPAWIGPQPAAWYHWSLAFAIPLTALLPATVAMGATLPAMERLATRAMPQSRMVGGLYAANTAGAVIGTMASTYWLMPTLGHGATVAVLASINFLAAALVAFVHWNTRLALSGDETPKQMVADEPTAISRRLVGLLLITGLLGIGYEVLAVRVMAQVLEGTVYSFAAILSVYLIGTTIGAALYQAYGKQRDFDVFLSRLLLTIAVTGLGGILALYHSAPFYQAARLAFGDSLWAVLISESAVAMLVFALPSLAMGATLSHLLQAARGSRGGLGRALALNTLGGALAPGLIGVLWLTSVGTKWALASVVMTYLALMPSSPARRWLLLGTPVLMLVVLPRESHLLNLRDGESLLSYREGVMASVAVVERNGARNLRVNNRFQMGGTSTEAMLIQRPQTHISLMLHPKPRQALFLGVASGVTTGAATLHPGLQIDAVELVPESLSLLHWFAPQNRSVQDKPGVHLYSADARRFVRSSDGQYDVIVADLFQPGRDGAGLLYTQEHFEAVSERLQNGGLFVQWLPFYQLDAFSIRTIVATFQQVFPNSVAFLANNNMQYPAVALIGSMQPLRFSADYFAQRATEKTLLQELNVLLLSDHMRLFGQLLFDRDQLSRLAGNAPLNTDDHPRVLYEAPRFTYRRDALPFARLLPLIEQFGIPRDRLIADDDGRMARYLRARNTYLRAMSTHMTQGVEAALDDYKQAAVLSEDFTSGYAHVVKIALAKIKNRSVDQGKWLLEWLREQRPDIPVAQRLLDRLDNTSG